MIVSPTNWPTFKIIFYSFMSKNSMKQSEFLEKLITLVSSNTNNDSSSVSNSLEPTFSKLFALVSQYVTYKHYFLLQAPQVIEKYFILCSDVLIPDTPVVSFPEFGAIYGSEAKIHFQKYDSPKQFFENFTASSVAIIDIAEGLFLVLFDVADSELKNDEFDLISYIKAAILKIYKACEVDYEYSLKEVYSFSENYLDNLSKRSFSVANYHPSEAFLHTFAFFVRGKISNCGNCSPSTVKVKEVKCSTVNINDQDMLKFMVELRRHYNDVPYHNWLHALDVTQYVYSIIKQTNLWKFLTSLEIFGLLFSSLCHDTDHNGMNNNFHRKAHTVFAHLAPNLPPLEHHHSCITMDLSRSLFQQIQDEHDRLYLCHFVINCIMATDMEQHKVFLNEFQELQNDGFDINKENHRLLLAQIILKAGDLSNTVRDFDEAVRMTTKLNNECHRQGDEEVRLNLPISPMCDRNDKTPMCVGQIGFYKFVSGPLMKELHTFFAPSLIDNEKQFENNLKRWESMKEELK